MNRTLPLWGLALSACADPAAGTAVGNLDASLRWFTPPATAASLTADVRGDVIRRGCDGAEAVLAEGVGLALDGGSALALPVGAWCGVSLRPDGDVRVVATSSSGFTASLALALPTLELAADVEVAARPGDAFLWSLAGGSWLDLGALGADVADVVVGPADPAHAALVAAITDGQALVRDGDGDGVPGDADEVVARSANRPSDADDDSDDDDDDGDDSDDDDSDDDTDPEVETDAVDTARARR